MSRDDKSKRTNPWGASNDKNKQPGFSGGHGGGGGGQEPPDLDEMLRRAQNNFNAVMPGEIKGGGLIGIIVLVILGLWAASGLYVVNPGEHAVIQRFGAWERTQAESGLGYHLPAPIESSTIINVEEIRRMNIGFIESYARGGQIGRRELPEEALMLTSDRNIVDLHLVLQWNIKSSENYLFEIRGQENTIKKVAESAIREIVGQTNMFPIITTDRAIVAQRAQKVIQDNLDEYHSGVNITQVLIDKAEVHPDVQAAFQDVQSAKQDAEDSQNRAKAYREDILPKARGRAIQMLQGAQAYKQSTIARSNGDAERFDSIYEAYLNGKDVTKERLYIETMEEVLQNAEKIIMDGNSGQGVVPYLPLGEMKKK